MNILLLIRALDDGGAERQLAVLAKGLRARGHKVAVAVFYAGGHFGNELIRSGVDIHDLKKTGRWDVLPFLFRFVRLLRQSRPDVIYGFLSLPNILAAFFHRVVPGTKIIFGIRATRLELERYEPLVGWVYQLERILARYSDLIIVNSQAGRRDCEKQSFPRTKLRVIFNGIDTNYFSPDPDGGNRFRIAHNVSENEKLVGIVGRLDPMKDHATFLRVFATVSERISGLKALVIGRGREEERLELERLADQLVISEQLVWEQPTEVMPPVYNAIDVLVSSSAFGEGFPNVIAEAMACETPCVVTRVGDSADIVGEEGYVAAPGNVDELGSHLYELLTSGKLKEYGKRARTRICTLYSVEKYLDATEAALCTKG